MMDAYPQNSTELAEKFLEQVADSAVVSFKWALSTPDTIEYGDFLSLDLGTQDLVVLELVEEIHSYLIGELGLPNEIVEDIYQEAFSDL